MLIRNIDPKRGMLNETRHQIQQMHDNMIEARVLSGSKTGALCVIPRINIASSETHVPFFSRIRYSWF